MVELASISEVCVKAFALKDKGRLVAQCRALLTPYTAVYRTECAKIQTKAQLEAALGQYWHLLHYFPTFLSGLVHSSSSLEVQTYVSKILFQELGEGDCARAHERFFLDALEECDLDVTAITTAPATPATQHLLDVFTAGAGDRLKGIGVLYATEATDLTIVTQLAVAIKRVTGREGLAWEQVHREQEGDHVVCSDSALESFFSQVESEKIQESTGQTAALWARFFESLGEAK